MPHHTPNQTESSSRCFYVHNVHPEHFSRVEGIDTHNYCGRVYGHLTNDGQCAFTYADLHLSSILPTGEQCLKEICTDFISYLRQDFGCPALRSPWNMCKLCNFSPEMAAPELGESDVAQPTFQENIIQMSDWKMEDFADEYWFSSYSDGLMLYLSVSPKTLDFYIRCYYEPQNEEETGYVSY